MKSIVGLLFLCTGIFFIASCSSDKTTSAVYTDSLVLGTGNVGWNITGETTAFIDSLGGNGITIYCRIETEDDMKGSNIHLEIEKSSELGDFDQIHISYLTNPNSSGHILVGSFIHTFGEGNFRVIARLLTTNKVVAYKDYSMTNQ
jgi:hypothetical protein